MILEEKSRCAQNPLFQHNIDDFGELVIEFEERIATEGCLFLKALD